MDMAHLLISSRPVSCHCSRTAILLPLAGSTKRRACGAWCVPLRTAQACCTPSSCWTTRPTPFWTCRWVAELDGGQCRLVKGAKRPLAPDDLGAAQQATPPHRVCLCSPPPPPPPPPCLQLRCRARWPTCCASGLSSAATMARSRHQPDSSWRAGALQLGGGQAARQQRDQLGGLSVLFLALISVASRLLAFCMPSAVPCYSVLILFKLPALHTIAKSAS